MPSLSLADHDIPLREHRSIDENGYPTRACQNKPVPCYQTAEYDIFSATPGWSNRTETYWVIALTLLSAIHNAEERAYLTPPQVEPQEASVGACNLHAGEPRN
ncbi:MAG: hypothetical protein ACYDER_01980 [Ktedonobacteraceae bacterium]